METLAKNNNDSIKFLVIYQSEAHPNEERFNYLPDPDNYETRRNYSKKLIKEFSIQNVTVLLDEMDNRVSKAYGRMPNSVFIIDPGGEICYISDWFNVVAVKDFLEELK